jgi:hypothetical protein
VNSANEAVQALNRIPEIDSGECHKHVERCFSIETMVKSYERVYQAIFDLEAGRQA